MKSVPPDISVIVPALNEAGTLPATLQSVQSEGIALEWIVVDGGSSDNTRAIAGNENCRLIETAHAQRAHQMNRGAEAARSDVLVFLHADTRLPKTGIEQILSCLANGDVAGGGFIRIFDSPSTILRITCQLAAWRSRLLGIFLGDQAIFVRREVFLGLGGFDESFSLAEDLDFSLRLRKRGRVKALKGPAISSARRFKKRGPLRQSISDMWFTCRLLAQRVTPRASPPA